MVFSKLSAVAGVLSLATSVAAHGHVRGITYDGKWVRGFDLSDAYAATVPDSIGWQETALDNGFVDPTKYATSDIACHLGGKTGKLFATVAAGSPLTVNWDTWPESHHGPVLDYLAPYADTAAALKFFKIAQQGYSGGTWAADKINSASNFTWSVTIPSDIAPGKYVLRHEIIALHSATQVNGAQNYPQCLNIEVTGSGTLSPAGVSATTFYKADDPGIYVPNFYNGLTSYEIPGPALYNAGSGSSPVATSAAASATATAAPSASAPAEAEETSAAAPSATSAPATTPTDEYPEETSAAAPVATNAPAETSAPAPTATSNPTPVETTQPTTSTAPESGSTDLPTGTKLSSVLAWLSKFYTAHGTEFDNTTALRRRHARHF